MSHAVALSSQNSSSTRHPLSAESRQRLLRTVKSALGLMQYYDGLAEPDPGIRALLLSQLLEAVAELDALRCKADSSSR